MVRMSISRNFTPKYHPFSNLQAQILEIWPSAPESSKKNRATMKSWNLCYKIELPLMIFKKWYFYHESCRRILRKTGLATKDIKSRNFCTKGQLSYTASPCARRIACHAWMSLQGSSSPYIRGWRGHFPVNRRNGSFPALLSGSTNLYGTVHLVLPNTTGAFISTCA